MKEANLCKEIFLDGLIGLEIWYSPDKYIPPMNVPHIDRIEGELNFDCVLHFSINDELDVLAESISAKTSNAKNGNLDIYTYSMDISINKANYEDDIFRRILSNVDYYVVLIKADGSKYFCYTLPGSFAFTTSIDISNDSDVRNLTINLKSLSEPIQIPN